ncbi:MAG: hypothetical protein ABI741_14455 [Ferruginibacter sp.]
MKQPVQRSIITDKLVVEKTGKTIETWFNLLDKHGAKQMKHIEIFALINKTGGLKPLGEWNHNLLATTYEWDRGLKERGQKEAGFEISVSKTITVPVNILYNSWADDKLRNKWLKEKITIRKATANKSARITWTDNETTLSIDFYPKGDHKSQVVVQHLKITDSKKASALKIFWGEKLDTLKSFLEK